jgi:hypothetical protein
VLLGSVLALLLVAGGAAAAAPPSFQEIDVAPVRGVQAEVAVASDPLHPDVLFAAANSLDASSLSALSNLMRTYSSTDGGATWTGAPGPVPTPYGGRKRCNAGDPAPAIDQQGRQYVAFLASACVTLEELLLNAHEFDVARLEVATRPDPAAPWQVNQVYPVRSARFDDKPAIAIDRSPSSPHAGRIYVAWTRITPGVRRSPSKDLIVVSHSDDGAATWSAPAVVPDDATQETTFASLAVDASGTVYVAWTTIGRRIQVDRSVDGGDHFGADVLVGEAPGLPGGGNAICDLPGAYGIPAQGRRCITTTPTVQVDSRAGSAEHVYVVYSAPDRGGHAQDVLVRTFDASLAPLTGSQRVHPADSGRDEFMPASAVDDAGRLWICFYDTGADRTRRTARYSCTASADGAQTFATARAVATVASNETKHPASDFQFGDYEGLSVGGGVAHPMWTDGRAIKTLGEEIYTTTLTAADLQLP